MQIKGSHTISSAGHPQCCLVNDRNHSPGGQLRVCNHLVHFSDVSILATSHCFLDVPNAFGHVRTLYYAHIESRWCATQRVSASRSMNVVFFIARTHVPVDYITTTTRDPRSDAVCLKTSMLPLQCHFQIPWEQAKF